MGNLKYQVTTQMDYSAFFQESLRKENSNAASNAMQLSDQNITYLSYIFYYFWVFLQIQS